MNNRKIAGILTLIVGVGLLASVWVNRYNVYDWVALKDYTPSSQIAALAKQSGLNDYGKRLFYVNDPKLSDRQEFAAQCKVREQTIVLGCYTNPGIYVFDVQEERLNGVEEVTAAHETLHAAYERLSPRERKRIDALTKAAYEKINDPELAKRMEGYKATEPDDIPNELHSILGTEVRNVGSELEEYYKKYFANRLQVVTLAENYEKVFIEAQNKVQQFDADLSLRRAEIERREQSLELRAAELKEKRRQLDAYLAAKNYQAYNGAVAEYNSSVNSYNAEIGDVKVLIIEYNSLVSERNKLAADQADLAKSLDSRLDAIDN